MSKNFVSKITAAIVTVCLLMTYVSTLTNAVYAAYEELENQGIVSNNKNVEFDAYFKDGNNKKHSLDAKITADQKLYLKVTVRNAGYISEGVVTIENPNFSIAKTFAGSDYVKSIDYDKNQINLNQIEAGKDIEIELPISFTRKDNMDLEYFSKEVKLNLEGKYLDEKGKERNIKSSIKTRLNWQDTAKAIITQDLLKYGTYNNKVYMQTKTTNLLEGNSLPIKSSKVTVNVPQLANKNPDEVRIFANTAATNAVEFTKDNWSYNKDTGIIEINLENKENNNLVNWQKGADEFYITYIYNDAKYSDTSVKLSAQTAIQTYVTNENVTANEDKTVETKEILANSASLETLTTAELNKGYIYANNKYETSYTSTILANVAYADTMDKLVINENNAKFVGNNINMNANNNIYYKSISISKDTFNKILGENGNIQIYDQNNNKIAGIDKNTVVDNDGNMLISINNQDVSAIRIETTKPETEGIIKFNIEKAIKATTTLTRETAMQIKNMSTDVTGNVVKENKDSEMNVVTQNVAFKETSTQTELYMNTASLTTTAKNENVEIKAILKSDDSTCDLFKNPVAIITLPNDIETLDIKTINLLYNDGISIKSYDVVTDNNGNKAIRVYMQGEQSEFVTDISKGINIVINTDITLKRTAANASKDVTLKVTNEKAIQYVNDGITTTKVNIYAPQGVVLLSSVSNFDGTADEIVSLPNKEQAGKIETKTDAKTIKLKSTVVNNYGKDINNPKILGRIPFEGNKKTDGSNLGSTLNTVLASEISLSGIDSKLATIYYSENGNATADLENKDNGWTTNIQDPSKIKSYLVVLNGYTMPQATSFDMSYNAVVPANLNHNENAFGTYTVYYDETENNQLIAKQTIAPTVGVSTGKGPELQGNISSNIDSTATTEDYIEYKVTVKNAGEMEATNAKVKVTLPDMVDYAEYVKDETVSMNPEYVTNPNKREFELSVGSLNAGESKVVSFIVKANKEGTFKIPMELTADNMEKSETINTPDMKVSLASFSIEFTSPTQTNVTVGSTIEYFLGVSNKTNSKIDDVKVKITLPDNVEFEDAFEEGYAGEDPTKDNVKFDKKSNTVTYGLGNLEAKQSSDKNCILRVKPTSATNVNMSAIVVGKNTNEQKTTNITHTTGDGKLQVSTNVEPKKQYIQLGEEVTYTVIVKNVSSGLIKNVKVAATIPDSFKYLNTTYYVDDEEMFNGYILDGNVTSASLDLDAGKTFKFVVKVAANKMIDNSKQEEDANVKIEVTGDGSQGYNETINNKIENSEEDGQSDGQGSSKSYRVSGVVWYDANRDGKRDSDEQVLSGIPVTIVNAETGKAVKNSKGDEIKATTDSKGEYVLSDLIKGKYIVKFAYDNSKYSITEYRKQGVDSSVNSDAINTTDNNGTAITDNLDITNSSMSNIDLGLTTKGIFNLTLNKTLTQIKMADGKNSKSVSFDKKKLGKIEVDSKRINRTNLAVEYTITITNNGNVAGYAKKIVDYIPKELQFSSNQNKDWYASGNTVVCTSLENTLINPGESKEVKLTLTKKMTEGGTGTVTNKAELAETYNDQGIANQKSDETNETARVIIGLKTGGPVTYILLTFTILAIIGCGAYVINKKIVKI